MTREERPTGSSTRWRATRPRTPTATAARAGFDRSAVQLSIGAIQLRTCACLPCCAAVPNRACWSRALTGRSIVQQSLNLIRHSLTRLLAFLRSETGGGFLLIAASLLALLWANSPYASFYFAMLGTYATIGAGSFSLSLNLLHWVNDWLMAVFFLLVGLEIKRELAVGALSSPRLAALPAVAALGGMVAPALIYVLIAGGDPEALRGWAIPAATDIAFALAALSLLGSRVPVSLKVFLAALATIDDLGAIVIIALFYTADLSLPIRGLAGAALVALVILNRSGVVRLWPYLLVGALLWLFTLKSGVHATLAGVALALAIPLHDEDAKDERDTSPLTRLEHALHPAVAYAVIPVFGLANAGVSFAGLAPSALLDPVPLGVPVRMHGLRPSLRVERC
ncbi:Na+/H+ antiporter NhaA [Roseomonas frigidaquae]|uniref:Na(+)/H(+) antiporter NhaA n=1 Tax=Falsiroseomonas frigidaquae TaxID=487318 RepID=A0ABX1F7V9_9PROT|nr:Na+/H+ antiporter NhaA [Falsiroseomonas frigidaquae]